MKRTRKQYTGQEKVAILRRHLLDQEPISKFCDEVGLQPTVFYRWQKEFFENGAGPSGFPFHFASSPAWPNTCQTPERI